MTSTNLWNSFTDEVNDDENENNNSGNYRINNSKTTTSKSFKYKTDNSRLEAEVDVPLKYLSTFLRSFNLPWVIWEIELDLICSQNCIISEISRIPEVAGDNPAEGILKTGATC